MNRPRVSDDTRQRFEDALTLALLLLLLRSRRDAMVALTARLAETMPRGTDALADGSHRAQAALRALRGANPDDALTGNLEALRAQVRAFAAERAQKVQDGINERIQAALDGLPPTATEAQQMAVLNQVRADIETYNNQKLIPFMQSRMTYAGLVDAEQSAIDPDTGKPFAQSHDWVWTRTSGSTEPDECLDAEEASPAPLDMLLAITGSVPAVHPNCACLLDIA